MTDQAELSPEDTRSSKVLIDESLWKDKEAQIAKEKRIVAMVQRWATVEEPPISFTVSTDWGWRCFVYPEKTDNDQDLHRLLAWFVRRSGRKFERFFREDSGKVAWWNSSEQTGFEDSEGSLDALFLIENFTVGTCKIVEEEKVVKVKKLVCGEAVA